LKAFSMGVTTGNARGRPEAIPFFKRAIELDPNFATAYAALGIAYNDAGEEGPAMESLKKAYALRERTSEVEKYKIEMAYHWIATGDLEKTIQVGELLVKGYPPDEFTTALMGSTYQALGQYEKALPVSEESIRLNPNNSVPYFNAM